jgi:hypothetical protein
MWLIIKYEEMHETPEFQRILSVIFVVVLSIICNRL